MANTELYIYNPKTKASIMIGKQFGSGWSLRVSAEDLDDFLRDVENDLGGSFGVEVPTDLVLTTGNAPNVALPDDVRLLRPVNVPNKERGDT